MSLSSPSILGSSAIRVDSLWTRRPGVWPSLGAPPEGQFARLFSGALEGEKLGLQSLERGVAGGLTLGDRAGDVADAPEPALELEALPELRELGLGVLPVTLVEEQRSEEAALGVAGEVRHHRRRGRVRARPERGEEGAERGMREIAILDDRQEGDARSWDVEKQEEQLALGQRDARRRAGGRRPGGRSPPGALQPLRLDPELCRVEPEPERRLAREGQRLLRVGDL